MTERATRMLQDRIGEFTAASSRVFLGGTAAISGFVAAASPDAIQTLTGSIRLLSAEIGRAFIPAMVKAVAAIQGARNTLRGMSDETKESAAQWVVYGVGAAGAVFVTNQVISLLKSLGSTAVLAARGIGFLYANPALAGLASLAASLTVIVLKLRDANMEAEQMAARAAKRMLMTPADLAGSAEFKAIQAVPAAEREKAIKDRIKNAIEEVQKASSALTNVPLLEQSRVLPALLGFGPTVSPQHLRDNLERARDHLATLRKIQQATAAGVDLTKERGGPGAGPGGLLTAFTGPQPQFFAIEQLGRSIQLAVLGESPLEAEQRRVELENNELFRRIAANTDALPGLNLGAGR